MPITYTGLSAGLLAGRLNGGNTIIRALSNTGSVIGSSATAQWGSTNDTSDGSAFKAREHLVADTVIDINNTDVVTKLEFIFIGNMPPTVTGHPSSGLRFTITLDSTLSVVSGGYLTVKGASQTNTYLEVQSSKSA